MAINFGATFGTATTDKVTASSNIGACGTTLTFVCHFWQNSDGGTGTARMIHTGAPLGHFLRVNATSRVTVAFQWSGGQFTWSIPRPTLNAWHAIVWTYDGSLTTNNAVCTLDGSSQTVTRDTGAPTGTLVTGTPGTITWGNWETDGTRGWDGALAQGGLYNRIWSAGEISAYMNGAGLRHNLQGLIAGHELYGEGHFSAFHGACTVTGTKPAGGTQPVFFPGRPQPATAAPAGAPALVETRRITLHGIS